MMGVPISIILPVYNSASTIRECLSSVLQQSFRDFECIVVDDGSTDGGDSIIKECLKDDARFFIYTKLNGGVSSARNLGLSMARGKYVLFLDADDTLCPNSIQQLLSHSGADLVLGEAMELPGNKPITIDWIYDSVQKHEIGSFISKNVHSPLLNAPWAKLFSLDIIRNNSLLFDETLHFGEDSVFVKTYLAYVSSIGIAFSNCYKYQDCGVAIYEKYSHNYESLLAFYEESISKSHLLEDLFSIELSLDQTTHVVYNMTIEYLRKCRLNDSSLGLVHKFFQNPIALRYLYSCNSAGIKLVLGGSRCMPQIVFPLYVRFLEQISRVLRNFS